MKKGFYLPYDDAGKALWLDNFATELPNYAATLGITPVQLAQVQTDREVFSGIVTYLLNQKNVLEGITAFKNQVRNGRQPLGIIPAFGATPALPPNALNDVFGRVRQLVRTIKGNENYNESIGNVLRIIGEESEDDVNTWKPILKVQIQAGSPNILWVKGNSSGIKIWVDRGDGQGFRFLAIDTSPDYLDKHPLPAQGQTALWRYQAIYILKDEEVGEISDILEVSVKGRVE